MLLLAIVALEVPLALNLKDRVNAEVRSQATSQADVVAATASDLLGPGRRRDLQRLAETSANTVRGRVIVVNAGGRLIADSAGPGRFGQNYSGRPEIAAALRGKSFQSTRRSQTLNEELLATAVPVVRRGAVAGAVRITQSVAAVNRSVQRNILGLALIGLLVLLLGLAAGAVIAGQFARPVRRLDRAAREVAGGDLDARAPVEGSSEQRSLARSFNDMTQRLARTLRAQQRFVADASHQLRTPLASLRLRLEEARAAGVSEGATDELAKGEREIDRLAQTVDELLVLSRAGEHDAPGEEVDLAGKARQAAERWEAPAAERNIALRVEGAERPAPVWCARSDLGRALDALVENALLYSPQGSSVTIAVRPGTLEVLDQGPGLAPGEEEKVFERFHRGRTGMEGAPGTGLGLAIARELARRWQGEATIASRPEGGARAVLRFPPFTGS